MTEYALLWHIHTNISIYSLKTPVGWIHLLQDILVIILQLQVAEIILSLLKQKRKKKKEKRKKRRRVCFICAGVEPQAYRQSLGRNSQAPLPETRCKESEIFPGSPASSDTGAPPTPFRRSHWARVTSCRAGTETQVPRRPGHGFPHHTPLQLFIC